MNKIICCLGIACLLMGSVSASAQKKMCPDPHGPGQDIYKHYKGTLGGKAVSLDLRYGYCGGSNYGGSTYYYDDNERTTLFYIYEPKSYEHGVTLTAGEQQEQTNIWEDYKDQMEPVMPTWEFKILGNKLIGKWQSDDKKINSDIELDEDYSRSVPMDIRFIKDSTSGASFVGVKPAATVSKKNADFIEGEQLKFVSSSDETIKTWPDYLRYYAKNNSGMFYFMPVYNDNGFLVLEKNLRIKKLEKNYYLNLDVNNRKQVTLNDIVISDRKKLSAMLETAVRKKYNLEAGKKLSTWFINDQMPVTDNIMIGHKGIVFCYNPGVIYNVNHDKDENNVIRVFLSYGQLSKIMKPDFRRRIGMK